MAVNRPRLTRRELLGGTAAAWLLHGCVRRPPEAEGVLVNDIHSQLNATRVARLVRPRSLGDLARAVRDAREEGLAISIAGGKHATGGQQFGAGTVLIDTSSLNRIRRLDPTKGQVEVEAGIQWPALIGELLTMQGDKPRPWTIVQKQTGADRLSIGGALSANIHGRGLRLRPIIADVESFVLVDAEGVRRRCSRRENPDLFRLAIGGYGLFGIIATVTLRLTPRQKLERVVEIIDADGLMAAFERRIADGFLFGDFQYATDPTSDDFLRKGVFSCYRAVPDSTLVPAGQKELSVADWNRLLHLSHTDKKRAFDLYAAHYRATSGQIYWSDTHQLSLYIDNYHVELDRKLGAGERATEMITEIYVRREALARFLEDVRRDFRENQVELIYGTIRLIERDDQSFLAWAREPYACVIFNLHVVHSPEGLDRAGRAFRRLIHLGLLHGGSYYLTYHRFATRMQVEACYPQFTEFLRLKRKHDPEERFQSEWYRHYRTMFADVV